MKPITLAFTSCFSAEWYPEQPVWREIAAAEPDHLVLLGDSIYIDVSRAYNTPDIPTLSASVFAQHVLDLYRLQLAQPDFRALLARPGLQVHAIWDDHDFLFNDAGGAQAMRDSKLAPLVLASRALFAAFVAALRGEPFPSALPGWDAQTPPPGYRALDLGDGLRLHLTDGRSARDRGSALLGTDQMAALARDVRDSDPATVHLIASGSTFVHARGESWADAPIERDALLALAAERRLLMLSGDIHENRWSSHAAGTTWLHEATASGAALRHGVNQGFRRRNWGLLRVDDDALRIRLRSLGDLTHAMNLDRASWQARPAPPGDLD
jgi:phosphodiesterase/alkaline phosphatase D-like protein